MWDYDTKLQGCRIFTPGRSSPSNIPLVWLLLLKRKQLANPIPKHWPWSWISLTSCCMFDGFSQGECPVGNVHGEMSRGRGMSSGKCPWGNVHGEMSRGNIQIPITNPISRTQPARMKSHQSESHYGFMKHSHFSLTAGFGQSWYRPVSLISFGFDNKILTFRISFWWDFSWQT